MTEKMNIALENRRLVDALSMVRRRLRAKLVFGGLVRLATIVALAMIAGTALDWFLRLPSLVRLTLTIALLVYAGIVLWRRIALPILHPVSLTEVAVRVQERFPEFDRGLAGAVEFIQQGTNASVALTARAIERAADVVERVPLTRSLAGRLPRRVRIAAVTAAVALVTLSILATSWLRTGVIRFVDPLGPHEWPRRVVIQADPSSAGDQVVALGESVTCRMEVVRGNSRRLRPVVVTRDEQNRESRVPLQRGADGRYQHLFEGVTTPFVYWFEAGDASTRDRPSRVRLVARPAVRTCELSVRPPPYVQRGEPTRHALDQRPVSVVEGSHVTIRISTAAPLHASEPGAGAWIGIGDERFALQPVDETTWTIGREATASLAFTVHLTDVVGGQAFENRDPAVYRLDVATDRMPTVSLIEPSPVLEVTPDADVPLVAVADDDLGISTMSLHADDGTAPLPPIDLLADSTEIVTAEGVERRCAYTWTLSPLGLSPGQVVTYAIEVTDNFVLGERRHDPARSREGRLKVISHAELTDRIAEQLKFIGRRIEQTRDEQVSIHADTLDVAEAVSADGPLDPADAESLMQIGGEQQRLAAQTRRLAGRLSAVSRTLEQNRVNDRALQEQVGRFERTLQDVADGAMTTAAEQTDRARTEAGGEDRREAITAAGDAQQTAAANLDNVLRELDQWNNLQDVVRKTRDLFDRQQRLRQSTAKLSAETIGQQPDQLEDEQRARLNAKAEAQQRLAGDVAELLDTLPQLADRIRDEDTASADALVSAEQSARSSMIGDRMQSAANAIRGNRGAEAELEQQAIEDGLSEMIAGLESRQSRMLAELQKKLDDAEKVLRELIDGQRVLWESTSALPDDATREAVRDFSPPQELLSRRTRTAGRRFAGERDIAVVGERVKEAVAPMQRAADQLGEGFRDDAEPEQLAALDALNAALDLLLEQKEASEREAARQSLVELRDALVAIRDKQAAVTDEVRVAATEFSKTGRLGRREIREVRKLATRERELIDETSAMRERVGSTVVYDYAVSELIEDMGSAADRLVGRDLGAETAEAFDDLVAQLDELIAALIEEGAPPDDQFAEEDGGAGGSGRSGKKSPVPTLAELRLLRTLQAQINARTERLAKSIAGQPASESTLKRVEDVGRRQQEVRELAERMIEKTWLHEMNR